MYIYTVPTVDVAKISKNEVSVLANNYCELKKFMAVLNTHFQTVFPSSGSATVKSPNTCKTEDELKGRMKVQHNDKDRLQTMQN